MLSAYQMLDVMVHVIGYNIICWQGKNAIKAERVDLYSCIYFKSLSLYDYIGSFSHVTNDRNSYSVQRKNLIPQWEFFHLVMNIILFLVRLPLLSKFFQLYISRNARKMTFSRTLKFTDIGECHDRIQQKNHLFSRK